MFEIAFKNLFKNKLRTLLSLAGIVIGVAAILVLVGIIDGLLFDVQGAVSQIQGVNVIEKGAPGPIFSEIDIEFVDKIERVSGVSQAVPNIITLAKSVESTEGAFGPGGYRLIGTDYSKKNVTTAGGVGGEIIEGRKLRPSDRGKVVIGKGIKDQFKKFVGNNIKINDEKFQIIGVYETGSQIFNSAILFTIDDLGDLIDFPDGKISQLNVELDNPDDDQKITDLINFKFSSDVSAASSSDFSAQLGDILGSLRLLVLAVAGVAALVAGVGIVNTMLMSVTERFKEIGTLKATGWTNDDITKMILIESALIGLIGGLIGLIFGNLIGFSISNSFGISILITPILMLQTYIFAVTLGLIAGLIPAYTASKLDPVEVLRME